MGVVGGPAPSAGVRVGTFVQKVSQVLAVALEAGWEGRESLLSLA